MTCLQRPKIHPSICGWTPINFLQKYKDRRRITWSGLYLYLRLCFCPYLYLCLCIYLSLFPNSPSAHCRGTLGPSPACCLSAKVRYAPCKMFHVKHFLPFIPSNCHPVPSLTAISQGVLHIAYSSPLLIPHPIV